MKKKLSPEQRERMKRNSEESERARQEFLEIVERVDARRRARAMRRPLLRRLFQRFS